MTREERLLHARTAVAAIEMAPADQALALEARALLRLVRALAATEPFPYLGAGAACVHCFAAGGLHRPSCAWKESQDWREELRAPGARAAADESGDDDPQAIVIDDIVALRGEAFVAISLTSAIEVAVLASEDAATRDRYYHLCVGARDLAEGLTLLEAELARAEAT